MDQCSVDNGIFKAFLEGIRLISLLLKGNSLHTFSGLFEMFYKSVHYCGLFMKLYETRIAKRTMQNINTRRCYKRQALVCFVQRNNIHVIKAV